MPINLRYGQQAVARGFLNKQRLDQVLAKQKQLAAQGKKVSVRMILEKAKLLNPMQLQEIDRDLNIKVVKKHTSKVQKPGVRQAPSPMGAQDFAGEAVPQFSGMSGADPDATVFSPPPPDMQAKVRHERERAKQEAKRKQEQEAAAFFDDGASPFGGDPFGGGDMAPEPFGGGDMAPEPFGGEMQPEPFGGEMQPEPFGGDMAPEPFGEMQPEPFGGGNLEPAGFGDESPFGDDPYGGGFSNEPQELSRMDSSPKLASLGAEYDGFASPDDEQLPTIGAFDEGPMGGGFDAAPPQPTYGGPSLAPAGDDFADFGNDIRSPEELESAPSGGTRPMGGGDNLDATMFSPPPPGIGKSPRQKTGAMDRTVFSPRPPEFGGRPQMEAQPAGDDWGEEPGMDAEPFGAEPEPFGAEAEPFGAEPFEEAPVGGGMDATVFSPPPAQMPPSRRDTGRQRGRQGADDFGDVELPKGKVIDDVPTAPAAMEDVHPLRRGVGTSSSPVKRPTEPPRFEEEVAEELPYEAGVEAGVDVPDELPEEEEAAPPVGKGKGKLPGKAPLKSAAGKRELPQKEVPSADTAVKEKKGAGKRVLLIFTFLLLVVVAILTLPIVLYDQVPQVRQLRDNENAKPIYDYVEYEVFNRIREWTGQPTKPRPSGQPTQIIPTTPPDNSADTPPAPNGEGEPADNGEQPADNGG
ncbi:MAG: hypothetical protein H6841_06795 [Planctomycetes bacterium]|nr:hypothetical protein [Planctomycetota bacterium]MCB9935321.1 hypothetical protein [Planctomycetota bacterium]